MTTSPLVPEAGAIGVRRIEPDPDLLDEWEADPQTERRLLKRLRRAAEMLT